MCGAAALPCASGIAGGMALAPKDADVLEVRARQ
jgi:hypothetical protein